MLSFRLIQRVQSSQLIISSQFHRLPPILCSRSKDELPSEKPKDEPKPKKNQDAINKLNLLLKSMSEEEHLVSSSGIGAQLAKPVKPKKEKSEKVKREESVTEAAKKVAEEFGGDVKQTESELLTKLLSPSETSTNETKKSVSLRDLISGMKVDRGKKTREVKEEGRAEQVRRILGGHTKDVLREQPSTFKDILRESKVYGERVDIFGGVPLGIFKEFAADEKPLQDEPRLTTWNYLEARELRLAVTHPPSNIYEEMIQWTEEGKLWHFPIDNEQGLEDEKKVYFTEHVFLEHHLDPWCPRRGPVRHFMELVCVGLSKNPYLTVELKLEHIHWFRDYFENKKQLLKEVGALLPPSNDQTVLEEGKTS